MIDFKEELSMNHYFRRDSAIRYSEFYNDHLRDGPNVARSIITNIFKKFDQESYER